MAYEMIVRKMRRDWRENYRSLPGLRSAMSGAAARHTISPPWFGLAATLLLIDRKAMANLSTLVCYCPQ